ncbi:MAG TPA: SDR family oxidoreductase [Actinomycetota bacterium]|nr:SDR family oxidoreductase [Actinomycetota bacterium]
MPGTDTGAVIVTGGASGLGAAVVEAVDKAGMHPVCFDLKEPQREVEHHTVDLSDRRAAEHKVHEVAEQHRGLAAVVCCAGIDSCGKLDEVAGEAWDRVVEVNLLGTAAVVRAALPYLKESRGRVVTVASTLGLRALSDASAYCASKFGVVGFTRALAVETQGEIGVTLLLPGGMQTPFFDDRTDQYKPPPDAMLNRPENVAAAVMFALQQPPGCEIRELVITPSVESSWP